MTYALWVVCTANLIVLWCSAFTFGGENKFAAAVFCGLFYGTCAVITGLAAWNWP